MNHPVTGKDSSRPFGVVAHLFYFYRPIKPLNNAQTAVLINLVAVVVIVAFVVDLISKLT